MRFEIKYPKAEYIVLKKYLDISKNIIKFAKKYE